jgi:methylase of polypeptide subunit release factors
MLLEHGWTQGEAVRALFREAGYSMSRPVATMATMTA